MMNNMTIRVIGYRFFRRVLLVGAIIIFFLTGFFIGTAITGVIYSNVAFLNDADEYSDVMSHLF